MRGSNLNPIQEVGRQYLAYDAATQKSQANIERSVLCIDIDITENIIKIIDILKTTQHRACPIMNHRIVDWRLSVVTPRLLRS